MRGNRRRNRMGVGRQAGEMLDDGGGGIMGNAGHIGHGLRLGSGNLRFGRSQSGSKFALQL